MSDPQPSSLDWMIARLALLIQEATGALSEAYPNGIDAWENEIARQLARYHAAAALVGAGTAELDAALRTAIRRDLGSQIAFLRKFGVVVREGQEWEQGWNARAAMYARSIQVPYWRGRTKMLPLPAMPAEGTQCLTNCGCSWEVGELEGENNYDAYWRRGKDDSCQTCRQREAEWSPVRIRGGVLEL